MQVIKISLIIVGLITALNLSAQDYSSGRSATRITIQVTIDVPIDQVWKELEDFGGNYRNNPAADTSFITSSSTSGAGITRRMISSSGIILDERLVTWEPENYFLAVDVYKMQKVPGVKTMGGNVKLAAQGDKTVVTSVLNYDMKNRFWGMINGLALRKQFVKNWKKMFLGYKKHIETGKLINTKTKLDLALAKEVSIEKNINKLN